MGLADDALLNGPQHGLVGLNIPRPDAVTGDELLNGLRAVCCPYAGASDKTDETRVITGINIEVLGDTCPEKKARTCESWQPKVHCLTPWCMQWHHAMGIAHWLALLGSLLAAWPFQKAAPGRGCSSFCTSRNSNHLTFIGSWRAGDKRNGQLQKLFEVFE